MPTTVAVEWSGVRPDAGSPTPEERLTRRPDDAGSPTPEERLTRRLDVALRRVRWAALAFLAGQTAMARAGAPAAMPEPWLIAGVVAAGLLAAQALSLRARTLDLRGLRRAGTWQTAIDGAVVLACCHLWSRNPGSQIWVLLVMVIIEAALREGRRAVAMTAGIGLPAYTVVYVLGAAGAPALAFDADVLTFRLGLLALVAALVGIAADHYTSSVAALQAARAESLERAARLRRLAEAGRGFAGADLDAVLGGVADTMVALGFDTVALCRISGDEGEYVTAASRGPIAFEGSRALTGGAVGAVVSGRGPATFDEYAALPGARADIVAALGQDVRVLGVPVWEGAALAAVLLGAKQGGRALTPSDVESAELLASYAGAALSEAGRQTERRILTARMLHQAQHDHLTGLPNRGLFIERVVAATPQLARPDAGCLALLFVDLDRFKLLNDGLGHLTGDALIAAVARRLESTLREGDVLARVGGDEFTILCGDLADEHTAVAVAERLLAAVRRPLRVEGATFHVTASIGLVTTDDPAATPESLLRDADAALHRAKDRGRDRVERFDPGLRARVLDRVDIERGLRAASGRGELELRYQPIVSLADGGLLGVEALLRWWRDGHLVAPGTFLDVAEDSGLIREIGRWVVATALTDLVRWDALAPDHPALSLSLNVAGRELADPTFAPELARAARDRGIETDRVVLEVTEGALMGEPEETTEVLRGFKDAGFRIALDDFGTGFSALSYLQRFPVDIVKIDRSFVRDIDGPGPDAAIVTAILRLAAALGLRTVAEGVETEHQAASLRALRCEHAQGYLYGRPMTADAIAQRLSRGQAARARAS